MCRECMTAVWQRWKPGVARPKRPATASYLLISAAGSLNSSAGSSGRPSRSRAGSWSRRGFRYPSSPSTTGSLLSFRTARTPIPNRFHWRQVCTYQRTDWEMDMNVGRKGRQGGSCNLSGKLFHAHGKTLFGKAVRPTGSCRRKDYSKGAGCL